MCERESEMEGRWGRRGDRVKGEGGREAGRVKESERGEGRGGWKRKMEEREGREGEGRRERVRE